MVRLSDFVFDTLHPPKVIEKPFTKQIARLQIPGKNGVVLQDMGSNNMKISLQGGLYNVTTDTDKRRTDMESLMTLAMANNPMTFTHDTDHPCGANGDDWSEYATTAAMDADWVASGLTRAVESVIKKISSYSIKLTSTASGTMTLDNLCRNGDPSSTGDSTDTADIYSTDDVGQTFIGDKTTIQKVIIKGKKTGSPAGALTCQIYKWDTDYSTTISGTLLASGTLAAANITTSMAVLRIPITMASGQEITKGSMHLLHFTQAYPYGDDSNDYTLRYGTATNTYGRYYDDGDNTGHTTHSLYFAVCTNLNLNHPEYSALCFWINSSSVGANDDMTIKCYTTNTSNYYYRILDVSADLTAATWGEVCFPVGSGAATATAGVDGWTSSGSPDWTNIDGIQLSWGASAAGTVYIDGFCLTHAVLFEGVPQYTNPTGRPDQYNYTISLVQYIQ